MSRVGHVPANAGRLMRAGLVRLAAGAVLAACALLVTPQEASSCSVSYGYRPSVNISDLNHHRTCSTGTSTTGVAAVAVLVLGAMAAAGVAVFRSGERRMAANTPGQDGPSSPLAAYLDATGVASRVRGEGQGHAP